MTTKFLCNNFKDLIVLVQINSVYLLTLSSDWLRIKSQMNLIIWEVFDQLILRVS